MIISQSIGLEWSAGKMLEFGLYAALLRNLVLKANAGFSLEEKDSRAQHLIIRRGIVLLMANLQPPPTLQ